MSRCKFYYIILVFLLSYYSVIGQITYLPSDLSEIKRNNKLLKTALKDGSNAALFQLGSFYERIFNKYSDTSIRTAIKCYTLVSRSDGPEHTENLSRRAAFKLALIHEKGKGIKMDFNEAMIYYFLSGKKGETALAKLKDKTCANAEIFHNSIGKYQAVDSLVIGISPFCKIRGAEPSAALLRLADFLKANPSFRLAVVLSNNAKGIPAPYRYWLRDYGLMRHYHFVKNYLVAEVGINEERIDAPEIILDNPGQPRLTIKVLRYLD